jgi:hypothetical protein
MSAAAAIEREIHELHTFFTAWFRGELPASDGAFDRFTRAAAPEFRIVTPDGKVLGSAEVMAWVRPAHGSKAAQRPAFRIWIDGFDLRWVGGDRALVSYVERQRLADRETARLSLAAFRVDAAAPCGWLWTDLQETWTAA